MFSYIFLFLNLARGQQWEGYPNLTEQIKTIILDDQVDQIITIHKPNLGNFAYFGALAELKNSSYAVYAIKITNILENNHLKPNFQILYTKHFLPLPGEKCLEFQDDSQNESNVKIFCYNEKQVIIRKPEDPKQNIFLHLNYQDAINSVEIQVNFMYFVVFLNLHQPNWQVFIFNSDLFEPNIVVEDYNPIIYGSVEIDKFIIKKAILNYYGLFIITEEDRLYMFDIEIQSDYYQFNQYMNQSSLSLVNFQSIIYLLTKEQDICSVSQIQYGLKGSLLTQFQCYSNNLQLILMNINDVYIVENSSTLISLNTKATYPYMWQYFMVIPEFNLLVNYGNTSQILIIYLENTKYEYVFEDTSNKNDYELDKEFLTKKHSINFGYQFSVVFKLTPYISSQPFNVLILEDKSKLINNIDLPEIHNTCFSDISSIEFFKMLTKSQFIYQQMLKVYYMKCHEGYLHQLILLRINQKSIQFFLSQILFDQISIYFDDMGGLELFQYQILNSDQNVSLYSEQKFQSPITSLNQYFYGITLQHADKSKTLQLINRFELPQYERITTFSECDYLINLQEYQLCSLNTISDGVLELYLYQQLVNKYIIKNYLIQDLITINQDQIVLLLKNSISLENTLYNYLISRNQIFFLREIPSYTLKPQKIMNTFQTLFSILATNHQGDSFLVVYDLTKIVSECLIRFIPYTGDIFCLSTENIILLKLKDGKFYIEQVSFSSLKLGIQQRIQNKFKEYYSIKLQLNNLISQENIQLKFTGLDFTGQLIQLKQEIPIFLNGPYQKINLNEYIYGPIHQVICLKNCQLNTILLQKQITYSNHSLIKYALIVGNNLFLLEKNKSQMINLQNIEKSDFKELNFIALKKYSQSQLISKLFDSNLQELLVVAQLKGFSPCTFTITLYSLEEQSQVSQYQTLNITETYCWKQQNLQMRQNIIILTNQNQLLVYQYNTISKSFDEIIIYYSRENNFKSYDHYLSNNILHFIGANITDSILIIIDLNTKSILSEYYYNSSHTIFSVLILDATEQTIKVLYLKENYPIIQHISIVQNRVDFIHIQELVMDTLYIYKLIYYDQYKLFFSILYKQVQGNWSQFSLRYQINDQENYTFPSQNYSSMDFLLSYGNDQYIFINSTVIGEILIFNQYEIQVSDEKFEIQVSNDKTVSIMSMRVSKYPNILRRKQIGVLAIFIGMLLLQFQFQETKRNVKVEI